MASRKPQSRPSSGSFAGTPVRVTSGNQATTTPTSDRARRASGGPPQTPSTSSPTAANVARGVRNLSISSIQSTSLATPKSNTGSTKDDKTEPPELRRFAKRPDIGKLGEQVSLLANLFVIKPDSIPDLYEFSFTITSAGQGDLHVTSRRKERIISLLLSDHASFSGAASDYSSKLISITALTPSATQPRIFEVDYYEPEEAGPRTGNSQLIFKVHVNPIRRLSRNDLVAHLQNQGTTYPLCEDHIAAFNILFARGPSQKPDVTTTNRRTKSFLFGNGANYGDLGKGLLVYQGFFRSVQMTMSGLMVNLNATACAMYRGQQRVDELITAILDREPGSTSDLRRLNRELRLLRVQTTYRGRPIRHTVRGIAKPQTPNVAPTASNVSFQMNGASTTVKQYFSSTYPTTQRPKPNALVVDVGTHSHPTYIPSDLCTVLPGQNYKHLLPDPSQTAKMIKFACRRPNDNKTLILNAGLTQVDVGTPQGLQQRFGLIVGRSMTEVTARILPESTYLYRTGTGKDVGQGSWNMSGKKFIQPPHIQKLRFSILEVRKHGGPEISNIKKFADEITRQMNLYNPGLQASCVKISGFQHFVELSSDLKTNLAGAWKTFQENKIHLVFVLLPNKSVENYSDVKISADTTAEGMQTVCIACKSDGTLDTTIGYVANVALKVNLKTMGVNLKLSPPAEIKDLLSKRVMFVGADVTHPGPDALKGAPSVAAVVATTGPDLVQYAGRYALQTHPEESKKSRELIDNIGPMLQSLLRTFQSRNRNTLPEILFVYRDGVSDGMFQEVLETELSQMQRACGALYPNEERPKIVFIIVQKRHHVRFFQSKKGFQSGFDGKGNVKPGLVVDKTITSGKVWDFYLASHVCLQGTSRPAHYVVLHDESGMTADQVQLLTHASCFLFGRATKSISVHPAARYADLMCDRARKYLKGVYNCGHIPASERPNYVADQHWHGAIAPNLRDTMFFI